MKYLPARTRKDLEPLSADIVRSTMRTLFPKRNDFSDPYQFDEVVSELARFDVNTRKAFRLLMCKHRRELLINDKARLPAAMVRYYRDEYGADYMKDRVRRRYWLSYPGLVRDAAELAFGEAAVVYAPADPDSEPPLQEAQASLHARFG
ncbi:MAG: hypothetical protein JF591_20755 [Lysobacter sp.]|nr:hypothetical protein [Lysobacter sp.]